MSTDSTLIHGFALLERDLASALAAIDHSPSAHQRSQRVQRILAEYQPARSLIVEGWRFLPHSYAIVNQWQLLQFLRRPNLTVKAIDMPFYRPQWHTQGGLFEPWAEQVLQSIDGGDPDEIADLTFRIYYPFDFSPARSSQTAVFGALEQQLIRPTDLRSSEQLQMPPPLNVRAITPSRWSAEGFYRAGFRAEQVSVVPHGVDIETFHPMPDIRRELRRHARVTGDEFVFLSVGAMTGNKGIDLLLQAFAVVARRFPHVRLVLKGMDPLYTSKEFLLKSMWRVPREDQDRISDKLIYFGNSCSFLQMARIYQIADAYVSPYRAEGFNLPVLEAAACGVPIICTNGGPTDDFVTNEFALRIDSKKLQVRIKGGLDATRLEPNVDHLVALMTKTVEDSSWRRQAASAGPEHVRSAYTWDGVTDALLRRFFN